jgi:PAS domain S-box-containing protein
MPDDNKYTSLFALVVVVAVPLVGVWEVFRQDESPSLRTFRLLVVLAFGLFLAVLALLSEQLAKAGLTSRVRRLEAFNRRLVEMFRTILRRADPDTFRTTDNSKYASLLVLFVVVALPLIGVWEVFRQDEPPSLRTFRLLVVLTFGLFLAVLAFLTEQLAKAGLRRDARKLEALNSELVEMVQAIVRRADARTFRTTFVNRHVEDILGYPVKSWLKDGSFWQEHLHPEDRERVLALTRTAIQEQRNHELEYRMITADGRTVWLHEIVNVIVENGVASGLVGISMDVTARKQAAEALKKSEEKFSKAFRESPMALTLTSAKDQLYIEVNEAYENCTGYRRDEVVGRTLPDLALWVDPGQRVELTNRLLAGDTVRNMECHFRGKDGNVLVGLTSAGLIEIEGESCVLAVTADITRRKRAEEALRESEERLRLAAQAGRMFASEWDVARDVIVDPPRAPIF